MSITLITFFANLKTGNKFKNINLFGIYNIKALSESGPLRDLVNYNCYH
jgi:hypothetical protein